MIGIKHKCREAQRPDPEELQTENPQQGRQQEPHQAKGAAGAAACGNGNEEGKKQPESQHAENAEEDWKKQPLHAENRREDWKEHPGKTRSEYKRMKQGQSNSWNRRSSSNPKNRT